MHDEGAEMARLIRSTAPRLPMHHFGPRPERPDPSPEWRDAAACKGLDPELWFADSTDNVTYAAAKRICAGCPVQADCLAYAIGANEHHGCWGGLGPKELYNAQRRDRWRRRRAE